MHKFFNLKQTKIILAILNLIKYSAWFGFFLLQGKAIQEAMNKEVLIEQLVQTLMWFIITKILVMFVDLTNKFLVQYSENKAISAQWNVHFPKKIYHDNEQKYNLIYLTYFDHLPNLYNIECVIINNQCTIFSVLIIVASLLIYTEFFYGLFALIALFGLNYLSKNIYLKQLDNHQKHILDNKRSILTWINQYFKSYREISFSWEEQIYPWSNFAYQSLYESKEKFLIVLLLRDIMAQLMVELPFIINTSIVIAAVYFNYLTITQMFAWVGFSQLVINASNAFLENKANQNKKSLLIKEIEEIQSAFKDIEKPIFINKSSEDKGNIQVILQDSTVNHVSFKPGIYHIKGTNGSGKSTLLNSILGFEREVEVHNHHYLNQMLANISKSKIRVIEREPIIFISLTTFNEQILGPRNSKYSSWQNALEEKMKDNLSDHLIKALSVFFLKAEEKYYQRVNGNFSSGEKILISLMRSLTSWDKTVSILVIDECTAFLDTQIKDLFLKCLSELSRTIAVYLSAHEEFHIDKLLKIKSE